jgi:hypothetical protein
LKRFSAEQLILVLLVGAAILAAAVWRILFSSP